MSSRTASEIRAELESVNATIAKIVAGGVDEFQLANGGDRARMIGLSQLREHRAALERELARVQRGSRSRFVRAQRY